MSRTLRRPPRIRATRNSSAAALLAALLIAAPASADTGAPDNPVFPRVEAAASCRAELAKWNGVDVFGLTPNEVLQLVASLRETRSALRLLPNQPPAVRRVYRVMGWAAKRGIVHSRAFRRDQTDASLPAEAAFENSLLRLERAARAARLPSCGIRIL